MIATTYHDTVDLVQSTKTEMPTASAFRLRSHESYLSVNWLEYLVLGHLLVKPVILKNNTF